MSAIQDLIAAALRLTAIAERNTDDRDEWQHSISEVREMCARAMVQPDGGQPIETAPTDDTPVDIWRPSRGGERCTAMVRIDLGRGNNCYAATKSGPACVRDATHWMPIPEAPK